MSGSPTVHLLRTEAVAPAWLASARRLMDVAFEGDYDDTDWDHGLGGWHALVVEGDEVLAHASLVERTLWLDDAELRCGYVESVATDPLHQGTGLGTAVMTAIDEVVDNTFELGVLGTGEWGFYERLGWERWQGTSWVRRAGGEVERTEEDDDGLMIRRTPSTPAIDVAGVLLCAERPGDVW